MSLCFGLFRYSLEPLRTKLELRLQGYFRHEAFLRIRFRSDIAVWEQTIEMYRDTKAVTT